MYEMFFGMYENEKCAACAAYCGAEDVMPVDGVPVMQQRRFAIYWG
jgi:hypothetical protein